MPYLGINAWVRLVMVLGAGVLLLDAALLLAFSAREIGDLRRGASATALIALAVAHAVQCPYCIDAYTKTCLEKGSNLEQMTEAVHVAAAIRGGATLVHGLQMRNVANKISM